LVNFPGRAGWYEDESKTSKSLYYQQLHGHKFNTLPEEHH
jgi:hypothetical protein